MNEKASVDTLVAAAPQEELKAWSEIGIEEKVDRLRAVQMERRSFDFFRDSQIEYLEGRVRSLKSELNQFSNHQHNSNGRVLIPLNEISSGIECLSPRADRVLAAKPRPNLLA